MVKKNLFILLISLCLSLACRHHIEEITIFPAQLEMYIGQKVELNVEIIPATEDWEILWTSSNESVITITQTGTLTAVSLGSAIISATSPKEDKISGECEVLVKANYLLMNTYIEDDCSILEEFEYYFPGAMGSKYDIQWEEGGSYTGNISVSAYQGDGITPYFQNADTGPRSITMETAEPVYIKVNRNGKGGSFALKYAISNPSSPNTWTFMLYSNGYLMEDSVIDNIKEILAAYTAESGINILLLIDKEQPWPFDLFFPGFDDTRLFLFTPRGLERIGGETQFPEITITSTYDANMGDAETLRKFINFSKINYPALHYALFVTAHGSAMAGFSGDDHMTDLLHHGEIQDALDDFYSVDLLGMNVCQMGNLEFAYEFWNDPNPNERFQADYLVASAYTFESYGWRYDKVIERITTAIATGIEETSEGEEISGGQEFRVQPSVMTAEQLARIIVEEQLDSNTTLFSWLHDFETCTIYNLAQIKAVKNALDTLAISLVPTPDPVDETVLEYRLAMEVIRDSANIRKYYGGGNLQRVYTPIYDLTDICLGIENSVATPLTISYPTEPTPEIRQITFPLEIRNNAQAVRDAVNLLIPYSYYFNSVATTKGLSVFFPTPDIMYEDYLVFDLQYWYNALNRKDSTWHEPEPYPAFAIDEVFFGGMSFCRDKPLGFDRLGEVDNWFELLDFWYDPGVNDAGGGNNGYQY